MNRALIPLLLFLVTITGAASAASIPAFPFPIGQAVSRAIPRERVLEGVVEAAQRSTVSAQTAGRIQEIDFDVNDFVPKGAVLMRLSSAEQQARLDRARAALEEATARAKQAEADYRRVAGVFAQKLVARAAMDRATARRAAARARSQAARSGVEQAQEQLAYTVVRAPYSGIVVQREVEVGESVRPGTPLMTGLSLENLRVRVDVPQTLAAQVRALGRARVMISGPPPVTLDGSGVTVFPYADPVTHTFRVRVQLPPGQNGLYPGMFVKVAFPLGEEQALLIPEQAVVHRSEVTAVYTVEHGRVALRQVRLGNRLADGSVEVLAGLDAGTRIALDPVAAGVYLKAQAAL
ncbi:MAG: efflux transporter periplasmic adaptor subunit [Chromatiales bacterium 21-64-14]|nr:MAG: efflux transporter periplasmic adaptor subunit [Chromatiales bacterium 21-64-14]HQU16929.1 efflux RND transporter periplasmic adaptor subunit [Gammaproteobacteria bacterium]